MVRKAQFLKGAVGPKGFPSWEFPEIAFAGRSNVGKSSAIRMALEKRCKVRISSTPGRTREINFFSIELRDGTEVGFVDLPGFGFAKVPLWKRDSWAPLVGSYLEGSHHGRDNLCGMVVLCDLRRGPEQEEINLVQWLQELAIPFKLVLTKSDKLSKSKRKPAAMAARKALGVPTSAPVIFSAKSGEGVEKLWRWVKSVLPRESDVSG